MIRMCIQRGLLCLFALGFCLPLAAQKILPEIPDSGHTGPVLSLAWDSLNECLFSAGQDGALRIWRTSPFRLERKFQVAGLPLRKIALSPTTREAAIVQSDGVSSHTLKVIDWETGKEKFSQSLPELPLTLEFSPKGTFVAVSRADWKSLSFYNARTGRTVSNLREGFGIVSFLLFSDSENTLLTYTPSSGNFTYWEMKTGRQKTLVRSATGLKNLCAYNPRFVLAARSDELVAVDMVSGFIAASAKAPGITKIAAGPDGRIISISSVDGKFLLQKWMFLAPAGASPGVLSRSGEAALLPPDTADAVLSADSDYFALADGAIGCMYGGSLQLEREGLSRINPVTDILAAEGVLYALCAEKIYTFTSDLFTWNIADLHHPAFFTASSGENPLKAPSGILRSENGIFFYTRDDRAAAPEAGAGRIARIDMEKPEILSQYSEFSQPLVSVREAGGYLFALEKNGALKKIHSESMKAVYEYPAWNIQCFTPVDGKILWAGKDRTDQFDSPLIMINTETGETVPVKTPSSLFLVSHIIHDAPRGRIYFLGLAQASGGKTETRIFSANNPHKPESSPAFRTYAAADVNAVVHIDSGEFAVYTTLGGARIQKWSGSGWSAFESQGSLVTVLRDYGRLLFGINIDGSVSAWEKRTGKLIGTFCILKDGSWIAAPEGGADSIRTRL
jgi:hypothetical protein